MAGYLCRLVVSLLSFKARITAITKGAMSLLSNSHNYSFLLKFKWYFSLKRYFSSPILTSSGAWWNNFTFGSIGYPSKSLNLSTSHLGVPHTEVPHLAPLSSPATGSCAGPHLQFLECLWDPHHPVIPLPSPMAMGSQRLQPGQTYFSPMPNTNPEHPRQGKTRKPEVRTLGY